MAAAVALTAVGGFEGTRRALRTAVCADQGPGCRRCYRKPRLSCLCGPCASTFLSEASVRRIGVCRSWRWIWPVLSSDRCPYSHGGGAKAIERGGQAQRLVMSYAGTSLRLLWSLGQSPHQLKASRLR